jgi:hypothetical protein
LSFHFARFQATAQLDDAVGQRRFAMIDVRDDGEISDQIH